MYKYESEKSSIVLFLWNGLNGVTHDIVPGAIGKFLCYDVRMNRVRGVHFHMVSGHCTVMNTMVKRVFQAGIGILDFMEMVC